MAFSVVFPEKPTLSERNPYYEFLEKPILSADNWGFSRKTLFYL